MTIPNLIILQPWWKRMPVEVEKIAKKTDFVVKCDIDQGQLTL